MAAFQCDVTPPLGAAIYSSYRPLETIEHPLLAKGIVLEDGGQRYVLCSLDWCEVCNGTHVRLREKMAEAAGTDASRIAVQTIHQHTAPMGDGDAFQLLEKIENAPPHLKPSYVFQVYFNGCGGDITAGKYNDGSRSARDELASRLAQGMRESIAATRFQRAASIRWRTAPLRLAPRTDPGYTETDYRSRMTNPQLDPSVRIYRGAMPLAFLARQETPIVLSSLSIAGVHILHLPGESMVDYQLFAQRLKPSDFVAVAAYGDCGCGYICTERAFEEGGYEPTDSFVVPQSEAELKAGIRKLLGDG